MKVGRALGVLAVVAAVASPAVARTRLPYDQVAQKSIHNAYAMAEALIDQLVYFGIRSLELDLRANPPEGPCSQELWPDNDWFVYHTILERRCRRLSDCLRLLRAYHDAVPGHEVITLSLELKGNDGGACGRVFPSERHNRRGDVHRQTPEGLDARLLAALGKDLLYTPADLLARCPGAATLQQAVARCGWPDVDELRGRFIVSVLGWDGFFNAGEKMVYEYVDQGRSAHRRLAFAAPLSLWRDDAAIRSRPFVVFHTEVTDPGRARELRRRFPGHILRSAGDRGHASGFADQQRGGMNLLMTDNVSWHQSPWSRTHGAHLYPFCPVGVVGPDCWRGQHVAAGRRERQRMLELRVRSDDLDGRRDAVAFLHRDARPPTAPPIAAPASPPVAESWTALVSVASNKDDVPARAKACLMARADLDPGSPYVAICRHGDNHELTLHWRPEICDGHPAPRPGDRPRPGCGTQAAQASLGGALFDGEDAAFVRLELLPDGRGGVTARAAGSFDGRRYRRIGPALYFSATALPLRGVAASSASRDFRTADGSAPRFLFVDLRRNGTPVPSAELLRWAPIGRVAEGRWRDLGHDGSDATVPAAVATPTPVPAAAQPRWRTSAR
jgi:hypothetical protein